MIHMIAYQDGTEMKVGDSVLIEDGSTPGVIAELIESVSQQSQCNVDEPGVMIRSPPFGLVFIPVSTFKEDRIVLVQRVER